MDIPPDVLAYLSSIRRDFVTIGDKITGITKMIDPSKVVGWTTRFARNPSGDGSVFMFDVKHLMKDTCLTSKVMEW